MNRGWMLLCVTALVVGCSSQSSRPRTYPATGKVTLNGSPLDGAMVSFFPLEGEGSSIGITDAQGNYSLTTFTSNDGALPGQYKVSIAKYQGPPPRSGASADTGILASGELDVSTYAPPSNTPIEGVETGPKNLVPAKYAHADSSGLRGIVDETSGVNNFDLR